MMARNNNLEGGPKVEQLASSIEELTAGQLAQAPSDSMFSWPLSDENIYANWVDFDLTRDFDKTLREQTIITQDYHDTWYDELRIWHGTGGGYGIREFEAKIEDSWSDWTFPTCGDDL